MGLIRKSLMLGTGGMVRGSSKKQRVAKATLRQTRQQKWIAKKQLGAEQEQAAILRAAAEQVTSPPLKDHRTPEIGSAAATPAGWYPDQVTAGLLRYFDGQRWTDQTASLTR